MIFAAVFVIAGWHVADLRVAALPAGFVGTLVQTWFFANTVIAGILGLGERM